MANLYPYEVDSQVYQEWSATTARTSRWLSYAEKADLASDKPTELNDVQEITTSAGDPTWSIYFPEAVDLEQYFISTSLTTSGVDTQAGGLWTSVDATPFNSGTWVSQTNWTKNNLYGTGSPTALVVAGARAIRFSVSNSGSDISRMWGIRLWATRSAPALSLVEAGTSTRIESGDLLPGTVPVGTNWTTTFRVANNSGGSLDNVIIQSRTNAYDTNGGYDPGLSFSTDGGTTWSSRLNLGTIANAGFSSVITARVTAFAHRPIGLYSPRIVLSSD